MDIFFYHDDWEGSQQKALFIDFFELEMQLQICNPGGNLSRFFDEMYRFSWK